jgi:type I restriction enzyme S subunit
MSAGLSLDEACLAIVDCEHKTAPIDPTGGYFAVGTPAMRGNRINYQEARRINRTTFDEWTRRLRPERGDLLLAREAPVGPVVRVPNELNVAPGQRTVLLRPDPTVLDSAFTYYLLASPAQQSRLLQKAEGSTVPHLNVADVRSFELPALPPIEEQRGIAATLGALDDKIESNRRASEILRQLGKAEVNARIGERRSILSDLVLSIARGVTPKYADGDPAAPLVLNQRCIRDNWVSTDAARHMHDRNVAGAKRVSSGDILVNSTGTGTLGRVGRWHHGSIFADSHISIVKPDASKIGPTVLAYLLFDRESDIEDMATGSTGQTELSPSRLGQLELTLPSAEDSEELEPILDAFEDRAASLHAENNHLASLRDTLLPELLSGRIRVPEAREAVREVVA